jgi:hypothetical protein
MKRKRRPFKRNMTLADQGMGFYLAEQARLDAEELTPPIASGPSEPSCESDGPVPVASR